MEAMMDLTEKTLSREEKYSGPLFSVHTDQVLLPNGQTSYREVVEHVDGVAVLALDERNNVLAVRQYRYVFGRTLLELPAGKLEPGEDPVTGALRELKEETGAVPDIRSRVVNDCGGNGAVFENGDRNGKLRNAVGKIVQAVNRRNNKT